MTTDPNLPPTPVDRAALLDLLGQHNYRVTTHDHDPVFTVAESQALCEAIPGGHTKNLFLKDKKGNIFLLTAEQNSDVNLKTLHKLLGGSSRFSFANADLMQQHLGVTPGSVTAFGVINDRDNAVTLALDKSLLAFDTINCHPLTNDATTSIHRDDLLDFAKACGHEPLIVDLAEEPQ